jgi:SM-20-related protein
MTTERVFQIDAKQLVVIDGLLAPTALDQYVSALDGAAFTRSEIATPETAHQRHFSSEMPLPHLLNLPLFADTIAVLEKHFAGRFRAYRAYTNLVLPGDLLYTHFDCTPDQRDCTALWYLCTQWHREWSGETVFLDSNDEIAASIMPKPGRLALFDGRIRHAGRPPSKNAEQARYTFAIKFERYN